MRNIALVHLDLETTELDVAKAFPYEIFMMVDLISDGRFIKTLLDYETYVRIPDGVPVSEWTGRSVNFRKYMTCANSTGPFSERVVAGFTASTFIAESLRMFKRLHNIQEFYIVGANPKFDQEIIERFLKHAGYESPFKFRAINIEERVAQKFGMIEPPGLSQCYYLMGFLDQQEAHSARGDVAMSRRIFMELMKDYKIETDGA